MIKSAERKGNLLTLTIQLAEKPYQSKSAIAKALKAGLKAEEVPATMLASSGGFTKLDGCKVSFNITQ